jgi:hypothetical protein
MAWWFRKILERMWSALLASPVFVDCPSSKLRQELGSRVWLGIAQDRWVELVGFSGAVEGCGASSVFGGVLAGGDQEVVDAGDFAVEVARLPVEYCQASPWWTAAGSEFGRGSGGASH